MSSACSHTTLQLEPTTSFQRCSAERRLAATKKSGRIQKTPSDPIQNDATFPGPLVLPDDDLEIDPKYPAQSFRSWLYDKERNVPSHKSKTIYVVAPPSLSKDMKGWTGDVGDSDSRESLKMEDIIEYLEAFYLGFEVKPYPHPLEFTAWDEPRPPKKARTTKAKQTTSPQNVGLTNPLTSTATCIRTRTAPDELLPRQLNILDLLDVAIDILPEDAYALVLLTQLDSYEDDDDTFCAGRAFGGSRVCVVSFARYKPGLEAGGDEERQHEWPKSHCKKYVNDVCVNAGLSSSSASASSPSASKSGAIRAAITASAAKPTRSQWLPRVLRTTSHELGHCLHLDHCVYYACMMQGSASIIEDLRQPPYLCPVCLQKVLWAASELRGGGGEESCWVKERYEKLERYCEKMGGDGGMFDAYGAWLRKRSVEVIT